LPYDGTRLNCDEYPFASTKEGAAAGDNRFSAPLVSEADNKAAGKVLNDQTYAPNRILGGDAFYVKIVS
jgi:hypothetical protein